MKHIVIIAPPMTSILDVAGPLEVFAKTADYIRENGHSITHSYKTHVLSIDGSTMVDTCSGLPIVCEGGIGSINYKVDTILIAGKGTSETAELQQVLTWLGKQAHKIRRIGSICAGAFLLAEAGLLYGRRATTHWQVCDKMAKLYPEVRVEKDPIYVKDGNVYTSAGISTGMDL